MRRVPGHTSHARLPVESSHPFALSTSRICVCLYQSPPNSAFPHISPLCPRRLPLLHPSATPLPMAAVSGPSVPRHPSPFGKRPKVSQRPSASSVVSPTQRHQKLPFMDPNPSSRTRTTVMRRPQSFALDSSRIYLRARICHRSRRPCPPHLHRRLQTSSRMPSIVRVSILRSRSPPSTSYNA